MFPNGVSRVNSFTKLSILFITILYCSESTYAQRYYNWRDRVDKVMEEIDSLSMKSQGVFYAENFLPNNEAIRETWQYTVKDKKVAIFQIRYYIGGNEFSEIYYLDKGQLICMENYETVYLSSYDDKIKEGEIFYFVSNSLMQYVSLGKNTRGISNYDRQNMSLKKFEERYSELQRNLAMK